MIDAMKRADSVDPAKYLPEIGKTSYDGVTAKVQFDEKGDLRDGAISVYQVKDGKWQYLETLGGASMAQAGDQSADAPAKSAEAEKPDASEALKQASDAAMQAMKAGAEAVKGAAGAAKQSAEPKQ
jgi:branched-chain amino acid transport system substrate-binding protein